MSSQFGFSIEIATQAGPVLTPLKLFVNPDDVKNPHQPLHFLTDAVCALSFWRLAQLLEDKTSLNLSFVPQAWPALATGPELYLRSNPRITALQKNLKSSKNIKSECKNLSENLISILKSSFANDEFKINQMQNIIPIINKFEQSISEPLIYNCQLTLDQETTQILLALHSVLFHLRALIAIDYNAHVQDAAFEALKVDEINDYISKADYIVNDAMLYHQFLKLSNHIQDSKFEKTFKTPMDQLLKNYCHNGYYLSQALPKGFLDSLTASEAEEALYLVQMDWLLGSPAGLLFKIREEVYGLTEGYSKIFWPETSSKPKQKPSRLKLEGSLSDSLWLQKAA